MSDAALRTIALLGAGIPEPPCIDLLRAVFADPIIRCRLCELDGTPEAMELQRRISGEIAEAGRERGTGGMRELLEWAPGAVAFAADPAHECRPETGKSAAERYPSDLVFRLIRQNGDLVRVVYSVDRVGGIRYRHASFRFRVAIVDPGASVPTLDVEFYRGPLRQLFGDAVAALMSGADEATDVVLHQEPRLVQRAGKPVHWEVPIIYHVRALAEVEK